MKHPERLAAGMSFANSDGKRHNREYQIPFKREPIGKLMPAFLAIALLMALVCSPLWWA